jgi:CoA-binding domain
VCFYVFELYSAKEMRRVSDVVARLLMALIVSLALMSGLSFWFFPWRLLRGFQLYFAVIAFGSLVVWRWLAMHVVEHWLPPTRIVMVGDATQLDLLEQAFGRQPWSKLEVAARLPVRVDFGEETPELELHGLLELAVSHRAMTIVASLSGPPRDDVLQELLRCKGSGLQVTDGATMYKAVTGRVPIFLADKTWMAFGPDWFGNCRTAAGGAVDAGQRAHDLCGGWRACAVSSGARGGKWPALPARQISNDAARRGEGRSAVVDEGG